jgi:hypothetical protein
MSTLSEQVLQQATTLITSYPLKKIRNDMSSGQYMDYIHDWNTFNTVWAHNYTASTINSYGQSSMRMYTFPTNQEYQCFLRGQLAHVAVYPSSAQQFTLPQ